MLAGCNGGTPGPRLRGPPPPPGQGALILGIRTVLPDPEQRRLSGGTDESLEALTGLQVTVTRVLVVHRSAADEPASERVLTVDSEERVLEFSGRLHDLQPRQLAFMNVPEGFVFQIRMIVSEATLRLGSESFSVVVPSGSTSGLKIEPIDGAPFEVKAGERTAARVVFQPFNQLIRNRGQGFKLKPLLEAEHVTVYDISPMLLDRIVVGFHPEVSTERIAELNAYLGASVLTRDPTIHYFVLKLPVTKSLRDAIAYYHGRSEVAFVLPDTILGFSQTYPCDPGFQNPGPFTVVRAPEAWDLTQGSRIYRPPGGEVRPNTIAVIDQGFDLTSPDLLPNLAINQGELLGVLFFDQDADGQVTQEELLERDTDGDGLISFVDLNAAANARLCGDHAPLSCDLDGDGVITPLDLLDGDPTVLYGWENGVDEDGNGRADDFVGWDFHGAEDDGDNLVHGPAESASSTDLAWHGTGVAGVIAAVGSTETLPGGECASGQAAGMSWTGWLVPIRVGWPDVYGSDYSTRAAAILALSYARGVDAEVVNASWGVYYYRKDRIMDEARWILEDYCEHAKVGVDSDKFDYLVNDLDAEIRNIGLFGAYQAGNRLLITAAAGNCPIEIHASGAPVFQWPASIDSDRIITVGGEHTQYPFSRWFPALGLGTSYGDGYVDLYAPASDHLCLGPTGSIRTCHGTSYSAPMVAGTIGLLLAYHPAFTLAPNPFQLIRTALVCNARAITPTASWRFLDVEATLTNANNCDVSYSP